MTSSIAIPTYPIQLDQRSLNVSRRKILAALLVAGPVAVVAVMQSPEKAEEPKYHRGSFSSDFSSDFETDRAEIAVARGVTLNVNSGGPYLSLDAAP